MTEVDKFQVVLLNGFDRSGTSAISKTLAMHPDVELFMQPFNSGPLRKLMYQPLTDPLLDNRDREFFENLVAGHLDLSYIKSHWFFKHSSRQNIRQGAVHIVKSTINHFSIPWLTENFPQISVWGIWREPLEILRSIFRNGFESWYEESLTPVRKVITETPTLNALFSDFAKQDLDELGAVALNLATRTFHFFNQIQPEQTLYYRDFCKDPGTCFRPFLDAFELKDWEFPTASRKDLNIIGSRVPRRENDDVFERFDLNKTRSIIERLTSSLRRINRRKA